MCHSASLCPCPSPPGPSPRRAISPFEAMGGLGRACAQNCVLCRYASTISGRFRVHFPQKGVFGHPHASENARSSDGACMPCNAPNEATNSRDRQPYVYIRYTNRSAWPYMRGTCRIRCSRDPQNRGFRETVTGWLVPIRLGPRASTACAIYIPTSSNIPCMHTSTTARARSSGPPERAYAHAAREH